MSEERALKLLPIMFTHKIWVAPLITGIDPHRFPLFQKSVRFFINKYIFEGKKFPRLNSGQYPV